MKRIIFLIKKLIQEYKQNRILKKVEKAIGFKLRDWQKKYIIGKSDYMPNGRCNGKTTACIIRMCLSEGEPLNLSRRYYNDILQYAEEDCVTRARQDFFRHEARKMYDTLKTIKGIPLRKIIF